ncbi:MAG: hypothetical protein ACOYWZ_20100 [Bacillota bacterium]
MKSIILLLLLLSAGCAAGAATVGYAAKASTCDNLSSDGLKNVSDTIKGQVISDL